MIFRKLDAVGYSDSCILALYYHLTDSDSQAAMEALAGGGFRAVELKPESAAVEGNLRAMGQSKIETRLQTEAEQYLTKLLGEETERGRFELPLPLRADRFSKPAHSTTLPPLRGVH